MILRTYQNFIWGLTFSSLYLLLPSLLSHYFFCAFSHLFSFGTWARNPLLDVFFSETLVSLCFLLNCPSFYLLWCWPLKQVFHYSSMFREFKRVVTKASTVMLLPFKRMCLMLTQLFFPLEGPSFHWIQISSRTRAISEGRQYLTTQESDSLPSVVTMY